MLVIFVYWDIENFFIFRLDKYQNTYFVMYKTQVFFILFLRRFLCKEKTSKKCERKSNFFDQFFDETIFLKRVFIIFHVVFFSW